MFMLVNVGQEEGICFLLPEAFVFKISCYELRCAGATNLDLMQTLGSLLSLPPVASNHPWMEIKSHSTTRTNSLQNQSLVWCSLCRSLLC